MPQENEKCCSYSRTGAVELSFLLSRTEPYTWLTAVPFTNRLHLTLHLPKRARFAIRHRTKPGPSRSRPRLRASSSRAVRSMSLAGHGNRRLIKRGT